jgi:ArsR family transcriptional regulator
MDVRVLKELREYYKALRMSQPLVSWHLRRLVRAGLIKTQREGREVRCSIDRHRLQEYEREFESLLAELR